MSLHLLFFMQYCLFLFPIVPISGSNSVSLIAIFPAYRKRNISILSTGMDLGKKPPGPSSSLWIIRVIFYNMLILNVTKICVIVYLEDLHPSLHNFWIRPWSVCVFFWNYYIRCPLEIFLNFNSFCHLSPYNLCLRKFLFTSSWPECTHLLRFLDFLNVISSEERMDE